MHKNATRNAGTSMANFAATARDLWGEMVLGAGLGTVILGIGGRAVMRLIAVVTSVPAGFSVGGTMTVVALGAASGAAGALLRAASHAAVERLAPKHPWAGHLLFALLLGCATLRGLSGSSAGPASLLVPLVVVYGVVFESAVARRKRRRGRAVPADLANIFRT